MSIFTQTFDPITGHSTWIERSPDYDYHQEVAQSAFADMLHDHERNQKYYTALKKAVTKLHKAGRQANVLDIGTGTGLLSMMAAKCGADTITACEAFRPMADCALEILKMNGLESRITLVKKRSTSMIVGENGDMKIRANILVTEVFDTELIGEGALSTFQHALDNLLEVNSIIIPKKATVWAYPIESDFVRSWNRINILEDMKTGKKMIKPPRDIDICCGSPAVHDIQLSQLPRDSFRPLLHPQPIFNFDWSGKKPLMFNECKYLHADVLISGTAHAIFMWWELIMDDDEEIVLSCAPVWEHPDVKSTLVNASQFSESTDITNEIPWRDHWMQGVYYLPQEISVKAGDKLTLVGCHDEYSFWFDVKNDFNESSIKRLACTCTVHLAYSRTRIGQINDKARNQKYLTVFRKRIEPGTICFCISDGSLLGLSAAKLGAKKVYILETNYFSRRTMQNFISTNDLTSTVEIVESVDEFDEIFNNVKADLVIGEPYYVNSIYPWDNLRFWYLSTKYFPDIPTIPVGARIRGIILEFDNLHKIRAPLGICENFDLTAFDKILVTSNKIAGNSIEVHSLWEYPAIALTHPFDMAYFDFNKKFDNMNESVFTGDIAISASGRWNGVALWIDWYLDLETVVSGGPSHQVEIGEKVCWESNTRQGVFLLEMEKNVKKRDIISWLLKCHFGRDQPLDFSFKSNWKKI